MESSMKDTLRVYAKGSAFEDGSYDLRALELLISNYRIVLDRLIAVELGKRHLTPVIKSQLDYQVKINSGSIEFLIDLILENKELLTILIAHETPSIASAIVKLFSNALRLRKLAAEQIKKGITVNININNNINIGSTISNSPVNLSQSNKVIEINDPKILLAAQSTRAPINELISKVDGSFIEYIDFGDKLNHQKITPKDRDILGTQKEELPTTMNIIGRLDAVHFSTHKGAIVSDGHRYSVTWDHAIRSKIKKYVDADGIMFKVKALIDQKRLDRDAIGFYIIDCFDPQDSLL